MRILAIIPCYNEEASLKSTVENLKVCAPDVDFIVVNDGSVDDSHTICVDNQYPVLDMPFNLGLENAVQTGMRYAWENGYDMALQFDADGQHLPEYIPEMVTLMDKSSADIVIGSRYIQKASRGVRGLGGNLLRFAIRLTTGKTITDPTSGLRLFNRAMIQKFANVMNHGPEPDTLAYLIKQRAIVLEIPVTMQERKTGTSYLNAISSISYMLRMFVSILIIQLFRERAS